MGVDQIKKWQKYVKGFVDAYAYGQDFAVDQDSAILKESPLAVNLPFSCPKTPLALIFSPHPDDEILTGILPFRLRKENGVKVINAALTLGSATEHRKRRLAELERACEVVGFDLLTCSKDGFDGLTPFLEKTAPAMWLKYVAELLDLLIRVQPQMIFLPHIKDEHPTHIAAHLLVVEALKKYSLSADQTIALFETEFWQPMQQPNMLVGVSQDDLAVLLKALNCHRGEVQRNPYHLRQPPRLMDNVRRGSEIMGSARQGHEFLFGEIYRLSVWQAGQRNDIDQAFCISPRSTIGFG